MSKNTSKFILIGRTSVELVYNNSGKLLQLMTNTFHAHSLFAMLLNKLQDLLFLKNIKLEWVKDDTTKANYYYCYCYKMNKDKLQDFIECLELTCRRYEKVEGNWDNIGPKYIIQTKKKRKETSKEDFLEWI